ncbi:MAG: chemotaxis-specific protein-glutamate methyltransferase CheB [Phycisphaerae bacterium]|nr:chemotaxis-specific protein-glutamate methyltransferase CheB [Phycisphaerae bacterium]
MVRTIFRRVLSGEDGITVVGGAKDPFEARELIIKTRPDVILLDIEMPRMDGITFLKKLMVYYPVPVIMCSGSSMVNGQGALKAIELGAVEMVAKPATGGSQALGRLAVELADKIRAAAIAIRRSPPTPPSAAAAPMSCRGAGLNPARYLVAIGASTGGTEAIKNLLSHVPADFPPVAIVQHMPEGFTKSFAGRLDQFSPLAVSEAVGGDVLSPGKAYLARGGIQMTVRTVAGRWQTQYGTSELVNRHCPSVDVLFDAVASVARQQAVGILLTGMGADGAKGLLNMRKAGAITIAQDKGSCVVYGMPKVAAELDAVQHTASPEKIPSLVLRALQDREAKAVRPTRLAAHRSCQASRAH